MQSISTTNLKEGLTELKRIMQKGLKTSFISPLRD